MHARTRRAVSILFWNKEVVRKLSLTVEVTLPCCYCSLQFLKVFSLEASGRSNQGFRLSHGDFLSGIYPCHLIVSLHASSLMRLLLFWCSRIVWIYACAVPPKPVHLLALGQDKKPKRIPPAPSRPLPAPPPPPKPKPCLSPTGQGTQPQKEPQKVGQLIERFNNSR